MRGLEELEPAVLHVGDVAPHQLELEHVAVVRGAEQHRLALERQAALARLEHAADDVVGLRLVVGDGDVARARAGAARGLEDLAVLPRALADQRVGRVEHALGRAVVALERHHPRGRRVLVRKAEDVLDGGGAERIDRLRVVADHRDALAARAQQLEDLRLQRVGVLVFVDQDVIELRAHLGREPRVARHRVPVQQQVVVVERLVGELSLDVGAVQARQVLLPLGAPGKGVERGCAAAAPAC